MLRSVLSAALLVLSVFTSISTAWAEPTSEEVLATRSELFKFMGYMLAAQMACKQTAPGFSEWLDSELLILTTDRHDYLLAQMAVGEESLRLIRQSNNCDYYDYKNEQYEERIQRLFDMVERSK